MNFVSLFDLHQEQKGHPKALKTFNECLDDVFGSPGIPLGRIMEVSGEAGLGKTQLCFQLCATVQLPACLDGLDGRAIYLDTEKSFKIQRMQDIAQSTKDNAISAMEAMKTAGKLSQADISTFAQRNFLDNILVKSVDSLDSLVSTVCSLEKVLSNEGGNFKLIVVDSIAFHFRYLADDESLVQNKSRTAILAKICQTLNYLAAKFNLAVVITNQATVKFHDENPLSEGYSCPALGESYSYFPTQRVMLIKHPTVINARIARLIKSSHQSLLVETCANILQKESVFFVTKEGIRDMCDSS